ncbi:YmgG-like glycine-zipper protein [Thioclava sp. ES.031]|uniref:YMGG-like glycine zipper-containing protein n=1 Tax=Thioclava sp. ES.031 TaxID=1798203 RepID=UPI000BF4C2CA|nr:YMGG-like glycine zipper-containing protein [Thioclava sp. ES.031]PFG64936.1 YmgG-like glycine-zipper protein [Thioclava sp. ES.031]
MKKMFLILPLSATVAVAGCQMSQQDRAAATGGVAGAAIGAAVSDDGDRLQNAAIGGAVGTVAGALIGKANEPGQCRYRDSYGREYIAPC